MSNSCLFKYSQPETEYEYSREHRDSEGKAYFDWLLQEMSMRLKETGVLPENIPLPKPEPLSWSQAAMFDIPSDETSIIRYMSEEGFIDLIKNKRLRMKAPQYFTQDCNEGYLCKDIQLYIDNILERVYVQLKQQFPDYKKMKFSGIQFDGNHYRDIKCLQARWRSIYYHNRKRFYISCWTENSIDQDNMWGSYVDRHQNAVAVVSTVGDLKHSIGARENYGLYSLARVKYVDIRNMSELDKEYLQQIVTGIWATNCFLLTCKQVNFADDREIRLMTDGLMCYSTPWYKMGINTLLGQENFDYNAEPKMSCFYSAIDPAKLIRKIILSPNASQNRAGELKLIMQNYNLGHVPIEYSAINRKLEDV